MCIVEINLLQQAGLLQSLKNNLHIQLFCEESLVSYYKKAELEKFAIGMRMKEKNNFTK